MSTPTGDLKDAADEARGVLDAWLDIEARTARHLRDAEGSALGRARTSADALCTRLQRERARRELALALRSLEDGRGRSTSRES